ncbi:acyltransferase, partial [Candidatus Neomarinimicrobiota bacterium]
MKTIPLSPIEHFFTGRGAYPIEFVFAYQGTIDTGQLRSSLNEVLEHFPPLRSHLVKISDNAYGLSPAPDGLSFQAVESSLAFQDAADCSVFLDPVRSVEEEPLTRIRLTRTPAGSVLGVSISHAVADGFSYFHFLSAWARHFHGRDFPSPDHRREMLIPRLTEPVEPVSSDELFARSGLFRNGSREDFVKAQVKVDR